MSSYNNCLTKRINGFTVSPIKENQYLIECNYESLKIIGESEYSITYIEIQNGPILHIGRDFLGMGKIIGLETIDTEKNNYIIIKVITNILEERND